MDAPGPRPDPAVMRRVYARGGLHEGDLAGDPLTQFHRWFDDAVAAGLAEPNAMVLATCGPDGAPAARMVLLKGADERGFTFYTNRASAKGRDLAANPVAALLFPWHELERQVRVTGPVSEVSVEETERYFASRPRESRLGAWASEQSAVVSGRDVLDAAYEEAAARWPDGTAVPVPPTWGGYRVAPGSVEFWQGRVGRLHDRLRYRRDGDRWLVERLAP